jgi:hypothetical protein
MSLASRTGREDAGCVTLRADSWADRRPAFDGQVLASADTALSSRACRYRTLGGEVAESVLQLHMPKDIDSVDPARLREVRDELGPRRRSFRAELDAFAERLVRDIESERDADRAVRDVVDRAEAEIRRVDAAYKKARLDVVGAPVGLTFAPPAIATVLASLLGVGVLGPLGIGAVVGLAARSALASHRAGRADRDASPWSYVLEAGARLE